MSNLYTYMTSEDMRLVKGRYNLFGQDCLNVLSTRTTRRPSLPIMKRR
jgi:hypothetical protein